MSQTPDPITRAYIIRAKILKKKYLPSISTNKKNLDESEPQTHNTLVKQKILRTDQKQIGILKNQILELEKRLETLEFQSNVPTPRNTIEIAVKDIFSEMSTIVNVYSRPTQSGLVLIVGHNSEDISNPLHQTQQGIVELEEKFPNIDFDPWILHLKEIQDEHIHLSKLIFSK